MTGSRVTQYYYILSPGARHIGLSIGIDVGIYQCRRLLLIAPVRVGNGVSIDVGIYQCRCLLLIAPVRVGDGVGLCLKRALFVYGYQCRYGCWYRRYKYWYQCRCPY